MLELDMFGSFESAVLGQVQCYVQDDTEWAYGRAFIVAQKRIEVSFSSKSGIEIPLIMQGFSGVEYHYWLWGRH